jgi:hypothetical protein
MERNVAPETKRSLLKKDVTEFDKLRGDRNKVAQRSAFFYPSPSQKPASLLS